MSIDLHVALDDVERCDGGVCKAAAEGACGGGGGVELRREHLDLPSRGLQRRLGEQGGGGRGIGGDEGRGRVSGEEDMIGS